MSRHDLVPRRRSAVSDASTFQSSPRPSADDVGRASVPETFAPSSVTTSSRCRARRAEVAAGDGSVAHYSRVDGVGDHQRGASDRPVISPIATTVATE